MKDWQKYIYVVTKDNKHSYRIDYNDIDNSFKRNEKVGSNYEYKGNDVNNYLNFNNQIFRILRINQDGSVDAVYSGTSAELMWNSKYDQFNKSDVYDYLNNEFVKKLDKDKLANINYCGDAVDDLAKI